MIQTVSSCRAKELIVNNLCHNVSDILSLRSLCVACILNACFYQNFNIFHASFYRLHVRGTNSLYSADLPLSNKQNKFANYFFIQSLFLYVVLVSLKSFVNVSYVSKRFNISHLSFFLLFLALVA